MAFGENRDNAYNIDPPHINGATTEQKVAQLTEYMFKLSQDLNWILNTISSDKK